MIEVVRKRLGRATGELYRRVLELQEVAGTGAHPRTVEALRRIVVEVVCGSYHDYRSAALLPKGDLVQALRAVPTAGSSELAAAIGRLITDVVRGDFAEDDEEGRRWVALVALRERPPAPPPAPPATITLTERQRVVFEWLAHYVATYHRPPSIREIAAGIDRSIARVSQVLTELERKGAATNIGGSRGWLPTRSP